MNHVRTGLDVALGWLRGEAVPPAQRTAADLIRKGRLGLVTNPSAATSDLKAAPDALLAAGARVVSLFGVEHGVRGDIADGVRIGHGKDERTGLPVWSLYGEQYRPTPEMLAGLDAVLYDFQDVGSRFYTFSGSLSHVMAGCAASRVPVIVLDRPNPLGGLAVEGPLLEPVHASLIGMHPIPIRHGATLGELGRLWSGFGAGPDPLVVRCEGLDRRMLWSETGLSWVPPSPNMPTTETALVYPGLCLIEGTNVSEARGTACPFLWFGAPWVRPEELAERLNAEKLPGVRFRPVRFRPSLSKHQGEPCGGCHVHVTDRAAFLPVATGVAVLSALRSEYPQFAWRESRGRYSVDRLAGTSAVRRAIDAGASWKKIMAGWTDGYETYRRRLDKITLYP